MRTTLSIVNNLHIICSQSQPAGWSPCWKCITYPRKLHFRAEVSSITQLIFDHMNKECWTRNWICIYALPVSHTLMRPLFRQWAWESIGGDGAEFVAVALTWLAGPLWSSVRHGRILDILMNEKSLHGSWNNESLDKFAAKIINFLTATKW